MNTKGFSLVEVLLAVSVFALIVTGLIGGLIYGEQSTQLAGQRARAEMLAEEGLEAVRNIRDASFSNLTDGTFGLTTTGNQWNLSGSSDATDIFTRTIIISTVDAKRKQVSSAVSWQQNPQRTGLVQAVTYLTNWKASSGGVPSSCDLYCQSLPAGSNGICRASISQCTANGETHGTGGDIFCTNPLASICCCAP